jgi:hypothetical protein
MFGGVAFLIRRHMAISASSQGGVLVMSIPDGQPTWWRRPGPPPRAAPGGISRRQVWPLRAAAQAVHSGSCLPWAVWRDATGSYQVHD